jgi:hypothetical protein
MGLRQLPDALALRIEHSIEYAQVAAMPNLRSNYATRSNNIAWRTARLTPLNAELVARRTPQVFARCCLLR